MGSGDWWVGERAPDEVCERQGIAGKEEQVTTQVCVQYTDMLHNNTKC